MTSQKTLVLATGNKGKVAELRHMLSQTTATADWQVRPQSEWDFTEADETGTTFVENAIIKARHACEQTGLPAIADDSGLSVSALNGAPGVYSARYAGSNATDADNINKLLDALDGIEESHRQASFYCVLVYMQSADDPTPIICQGRWNGRILTQPKGEEGFGYDPIFWVEEKNSSAAQLNKTEKQALSHRGQALKQLLGQLTA
ncbi:RdgB/HAM1 family non-canonical purine NTP pyrophosphatase [Idiomarina sp. HP20-50]|uniref:RdgB/HAM1 family non-canonical purine NTP pyrophosphatase n=1 Tax=Idiomarina sp. HP20-50 TaxID=3070813 RepID=UPI00294B34FB|nr:RdgB/HAM1 family non-canonical purine NTP pyrophosphatase [Idiomarina sp. HP20-50]MDV6315813.1 RdgB/HAM1 family non-canonical purine NTP pyrophosphatase [Idiomarina sp. HP20-50]